MKVVILQSNYIPWKGYFDLINDADVFCFYDEVQYTKNDWRNRNKILGPNGLFWLTIPVEKEAVKDKISKAQITNHSWQQKHFRTIEQTYAKSINKNEILSLISPIFLKKEWTSLSELNQELIKRISNYIGIQTKFKNSANYSLEGDRIPRLINLVQQLNGTKYISGPAAKNYLSDNEELFINEGIELIYKDYGPYSKYETKKESYEDFVSILDVLMNVSQKDCINYITS